MHEVWYVAEGWDETLAARGLTSVPRFMEAAGRCRVLSSDRSSAAVRLPGEPSLLLKWRRPRRGKRGKTLLRPSRERKEARALLLARALGIPCPPPLCVVERRHLGALVGAVLVRPFLERMVGADVVLAAGEIEPDALVFSRSLAGWHDAGFRHGNCYPKNVLLDAGRRVAVPIGAPAAHRHRPGRDLDRRRRKDLAQWAAGLAELGFSARAFAFLEAYARSAHLGEDAGRLERAVRPHYERVLRKKAARLRSRAAREPEGPPPPGPLAPDDRDVPRRVRPLQDLARRL